MRMCVLYVSVYHISWCWVTFRVVWSHRMCCGYGLIECLVRMWLLYARCSISYSMYIHILLCLGGCRTLCVTMYVASPLNLLRRLPFILNTLCQNKSGISFEPSCSYGKGLGRNNITEHPKCVAQALCLSYTGCKEILTMPCNCQRFFPWYEINSIWNNSYVLKPSNSAM